MNLNLEGKVVIVTGGARGIGRAIALAFAQEGSNVVIDDIDLGAANIVAKEAERLGVQAIAVRADVTKLDEVKQMVSDTLSKFGRLEILVNNAGILYTEGKPMFHKSFQECKEEGDFTGEINVSLYGTIYCTRAVLQPMLNQKRGAIINIVSDAGRTSAGPHAPHAALYGAGKGGVIGFSMDLASEFGPFGIRVNCVSPGLIKTAYAEAVESGIETSPEAVKYVQSFGARVKQIPLGRVGTPQDVANVVMFLASDASSYITGQTLSVNGGSFIS